MKLHKGIWLPDSENHFQHVIDAGPEFAGAGTYQFVKFQRSFQYIKNFRQAVDIGAHCGLWSRVLARCFALVSAFEPLVEHQHCFHQNLPADDYGVQPKDPYQYVTCGGAMVSLYPFALGEKPGNVSLSSNDVTTGSTFVTEGGQFSAEMRKLDSFDLPAIDFIKIDTEGYELPILRGAKKTIMRDKPCMIVEQKPGRAEQHGLAATGAVEQLQEWGAVLRFKLKGDYCLSWD